MLTYTHFHTFRARVNFTICFLIVSIAAVTLNHPVAFAQSASGQATDPIRLPSVVINVYGEPEDVQKLPVSVTGVPGSVLNSAGLVSIGDAELLAPNTFFSKFSARKLSNARFRGISSSPSNPGILTYIDGVPQLNAHSSNIELMDIEQLEFVRGPQSALFGRSSLGGLISMTTQRPSMSEWTTSVIAPVAMKYKEWGARLSTSGPLKDNMSVGLTFGQDQRAGFTINDVTGRDLDYRKATYGKAQVLWTPTSEWQARFIVTGERARDGDYALNDLTATRQTPFHVQRDFEGFTHRDILSSTIQTRREGDRFNFETITGAVRWKTRDMTELDLSTRQLFTRDNRETDLQLTQEVRLASGASKLRLTDNVSLGWQTGVFLYTQDYDQDSTTVYPPFLLSPSVLVEAREHSPQSELKDKGIGVYGQTTATFGESFNLTFGMRMDHENKRAELTTSYEPEFAPARTTTGQQNFTYKSPQFSATYNFQDGRMIYGSYGRGFKAGGFNGSAPTGRESYGQEEAWHLESGVKTVMADGKFSANGSVFYIEWDAMQLNVPNPNTWAQYYISNVGSARSEGVEFDLNARPHKKVDIFGAVGLTRARFIDGTATSGNGTLAGKILPNTPGLTMSGGSQLSQDLSAGLTLYGRAEMWLNGGFEYDEANTQRQTAYSLLNYRVGLKHQRMFGEVWVKNAFDRRYIPVAFAYPRLVPSGFVGEMGPPRRVGARLGFTF